MRYEWEVTVVAISEKGNSLGSTSFEEGGGARSLEEVKKKITEFIESLKGETNVMDEKLG